LMNKVRIRQVLRRKRRAIPRAKRQQAAKALLRKALPLLRHYHRVAFYFPLGEEIDPSYVFKAAVKQKKKVYLPVLQGKQLYFTSSEAHAWKKNRFGIPEPQGEKISPRNLDLVFVPLVGFDRAKHRLGMGGGFYDRTFAFLRHRKYWRAPKLVGLAFDEQEVDILPAEPWDIQLDDVITPNLWRDCHTNDIN
jgi:5-formyltetrahydrofolate cyclo-ligase